MVPSPSPGPGRVSFDERSPGFLTCLDRVAPTLRGVGERKGPCQPQSYDYSVSGARVHPVGVTVQQSSESTSRRKVTDLVSALVGRGGDRRAKADELFHEVYGDLRRLARRMMLRERPGHTLEPTGLVHEAYMKLVDQSRVDWRGQTHFFAVGARVMRRLLVDHARQRAALKRAGDRQRVTLSDSLGLADRRGGLSFEDLLTLDSALNRLGELDPRAADVVELRFFGGLSSAEVAEVQGVSQRTVEGDWAHARAWLRRELGHESSGDAR